MILMRVGFAAVAFVAFGAAANAAGIVCREDFQIVNGKEIATPYCADNYVAHVARSYGYSVTDKAVRNNPGLKNEICRNIGDDIRIQEYCDVDDGPDFGP